MSKEITSEILKDYFDIDNGEEYSTKICEVKWNGRTPKGYDIRKYKKEDKKLLKGITVSYDGFKDLIYNSIENGLVDPDEVQLRAKKRKNKIIDFGDFQDMFSQMNDTMKKYKRDKFGLLRDSKNRVVMTRRRK